MKKYYIGGLLTLVTIVFATVTLAVNKDVISYRRYIYTPPTKAGSIVFVVFAIYIAVLLVGVLVYAIYRHFHKDEWRPVVARLHDWSSLLFGWNVCSGDHWSPVCVIGVRCCLSGTCVGATIGRPLV